jgi:hypothetical protein
MCAHSPSTLLFSWSSVRASSLTWPYYRLIESLQYTGALNQYDEYGSAHTTTIRYRPTNKFDGLPDCLHESGNSRPTANRYGHLCARASLPILSADRLFRSERWKGIVIRFFVMTLSNVAVSLLVKTLIVYLIGEVEKRPALNKNNI